MSTYKILKALSAEELEELVNSHLKDGWILVGGLSMGNGGSLGIGAASRVSTNLEVNVIGLDNVLIFCQAVILT